MAFQIPNQQPKSPKPMGQPTSNFQPAPARPVGKKSSWLKSLITLIVVIVIIGGGIYLISDYTGISLPSMSSVKLNGEWQAVFLTNGQVYFGKIVRIDDEIVTLKDIYYLQVVEQPLQTSQQGAAEQDQTQKQEQRLTLIKLGNEIHGPKDEMMINRDQVIIIEDLKDDSRVVQAINDYLNQKDAAPAGTDQAAQPTLGQ
jgi:hypothetical protein